MFDSITLMSFYRASHDKIRYHRHKQAHKRKYRNCMNQIKQIQKKNSHYILVKDNYIK